jgi:hypothetical protein
MSKPPVKTLLGLALASTLLLGTAPATAHEGDASHLSPQVLAQIAQARRATARFHDIDAAFAAGYGPGPVVDLQGRACIDQPGQGAMGVHYVNGNLLTTQLSALAPQALIYEPMADGTQRLVGAEYLVFKSAWDGLFPGTRPMLFEQEFHLVPTGNRYGLPAFYALHLWLWQPNRSGLFADWNPAVRCP